MRKLLVVVLSFVVLLTTMVCVTTSAEEIDLSTYSDEAILALYKKVEQEAISRGIASINGVPIVRYEVVSKYDAGTIGYASDEQEAKKKAVKTQSPYEYSDFAFLQNIVNSMDYAMGWVYENQITNDSYDENEIKEAKRKLEYLVSQAKQDYERIKKVVITINNADEYEEALDTINKSLNYESLLK